MKLFQLLLRTTGKAIGMCACGLFKVCVMPKNRLIWCIERIFWWV